ncbi:MAG: CBS domain-containing protein [Anaerolineae bacterium]|jgi:acetoin utilization protein AcuB
MLVKDRMSAPAVTVTPDAVFRDALRLMHGHGFRRLPVVDGGGRLVGIVSEGDLQPASPSRAGSPSVWEQNYMLAHVKIRDTMTEEVITTTPNTPIEDVARLMIDTRTGALPVVDEQDRVVGVVTETDILKAFVEMFGGGHAGLRLTLQIPEGRDVLLELAQAISGGGGTIVSVGSFGGDVRGEQGLVVKVSGASKDRLVDVLEALNDHVVEARDL